MRKKVIAGNWKMNKVSSEAEQFMDEVAGNIPSADNVEAIVCAPFPYLSSLVHKAKKSGIKVSAQTMHFAKSGAYTGEVSPVMLQDIGVTHVIIGHSERREYFAETDETVNEKTKAAFEHHLTPIVCVGETLEQREANETMNHIEKQVSIALEGISDENVKNIIIAYEPVWAIGTGKTASSDDANEVCAHIRQVVAQQTSNDIAEKVIIQYGGSVNPDNIKELLAQSDIDGALVGGASLEASSFLKLIEAGTK